MLNHLILVSISNLGPAYSVSDERSAMTRHCAISPSDATDTAISSLRQLSANSPPTRMQSVQSKGNLMVHCWNFPASRSKPKAEWEKKIPYLYKSTKTSKGFYQIRSSLKARAY